MDYHIELEREEDGRWIAEVPELPGVLVYGADRAEALARVQALAPRPGRAAGAWRGRSRAGQRELSCRVSHWPSAKARRVLAALLRIGWSIKRQEGTSHRTLSREG